MSTKAPPTIKVTVSFPVSKKGPLKDAYPPEATVGQVRDAAMTHFGVVDSVTGDTQLTYVLTHRGRRQDNAAALSSVAEKARPLAFRLVKVITQG